VGAGFWSDGMCECQSLEKSGLTFDHILMDCRRVAEELGDGAELHNFTEEMNGIRLAGHRYVLLLFILFT